ncbi:DUF72 domain-containing protein [Anatilimnocola floriformis]|uniref:DUF72 domain-containing protein n=1 Tax=Anatilimnocola floriformis TaxID=2948575 RepID=UPI0020C44C19|nr:DUF72 domain-containing protein [Anatilimnocola floriformis]
MVIPTAANRLRIGCAGWNIPRNATASFPKAGSHLQKYATSLTAVEINTSFYRPHRPSTYARWAATVPANFRFSVKVPKQITHELRLRDASEPVEQFLTEVCELGDRLGCLLVQLPPSLQFESDVARSFFSHLRDSFVAGIACEPRHATWFSNDAHQLLGSYSVARVAADPELHPGAKEAGGTSALQYFRLHGSPQTYHSPYSGEYLEALANRLTTAGNAAQEIWCIFDNTAAGHAPENALQLKALTEQGVVSSP